MTPRHRELPPKWWDIHETGSTPLLRILRRLRERGLAAVLVRFPHHHTDWEVRPATWGTAHASALEAVCKEPDLQGIPYWDFERSPSYPDAEFRDCGHLNVRGTKRFAEMLNRRILELLESKRSRSAPGDRADIAHSARTAVRTDQ